MRVPLPDDEYKEFTAALGHLCMFWAHLDREVNYLIGALLGATEQQAACIATELSDVAPRCRLVRTLSYTLDVPQDWRDALGELCNLISNSIGPQRNRFVHDNWMEAGTAMKKTDRRVKIAKSQSFQPPGLMHEMTQDVTRHSLEELTVKALMAMARVATARFDIEKFREEGVFPAAPQLSIADVRWTAGFKLRPNIEDADAASPPTQG